MLPNDSVTYADIPGFPNYRCAFFADRTEIQSCWTRKANGLGGGSQTFAGELWKPLVQQCRRSGYPEVCLHQGETQRTCKVHHLVLICTKGPKLPGMECRHLNGVRSDNRPSNLVWGTRQENEDDKTLAGGRPAGSKHQHSKLREIDIPVIRSRFAAGHRIAMIAADYGVSRSTIHSVTSGRNWRHVA